MIVKQKDVQTKLTKGLLDLIVLQLLESHPMHGYEIITTIRKSFGVYFGASTIYPLLNEMEKKKCIKSVWNTDNERPRKVYALTNDGLGLLQYTAGSLEFICKMIGTNKTNDNTDIKQPSYLNPQEKKLYSSIS